MTYFKNVAIIRSIRELSQKAFGRKCAANKLQEKRGLRQSNVKQLVLDCHS